MHFVDVAGFESWKPVCIIGFIFLECVTFYQINKFFVSLNIFSKCLRPDKNDFEGQIWPAGRSLETLLQSMMNDTDGEKLGRRVAHTFAK